MATAILHAATRVIRRTTSDVPPELLPDEIAATLPPTITDLAGGPWVLNVDGTRRVATPAEVDAADSLPQLPEIQQIVDALVAIRDAPSPTPTTIAEARTALQALDNRTKVFAIALLVIYNRARRYGF